MDFFSLCGYIILHIRICLLKQDFYWRKNIVRENRSLKKIVVSAINISDGGALSILKECLGYLSSNLANEYEIIALVNNKAIFDYKNIKFYSFPKSKKSWLARLYYEYIYFYGFSKKLKPYLWVSLHDMTPNVKADIQAVYCHNPSPFYKLSSKEAFLGGYKFLLFNLFYRYLYAINIKRNKYVIVQQDALRRKFKKFAEAEKVVVAHPTMSNKKQAVVSETAGNSFFYPAFARIFKNFGVICKATEILLSQGINNFQVILTISGNENKYARYIYNSYKHVENIKFIGVQSREKTFELYNESDCVIFPSKLETWGLPITEAKSFSKPILLADLDYAHEAIGAYDRVKFFNPEGPAELAAIMKEFINKKIKFRSTSARYIEHPYAQNWKQLFDILL
ncbi:MAG: glycosyltransferase family 4 protein [PVC group bacterium]|nr:glycosyltransferase family 4 protein [PVC group bacterium]